MNVSAIVLAAGESVRMEGPHKMLLPAPVEPVVRRSTRSLVASGVQEVVVVTGHQAEQVAQALEGLRVRIVHNPDYRQGQMTSVNTGLAALGQGCDAVMICLADQILLTADDYAALVHAYEHRPHGSILVPRFQGRRGNPIVFDSRHVSDILEGRRRSDKLLGCRKLVQDNPDAVYAHEVEHDAYVSDLDTPGDYARLLARLMESEPLMP